MSSYKSFFKDKKVLVVGLGTNFEAISDISFLIKAGAIVSIVDMRQEARIESAVKKIQALGMISCEFGNMASSHVEGKDIVIKALDVAYDVPCIKEAVYRNIPVELSSTLFLKLAPPIILVGVFGNCGKSTTTHIIQKILQPQFDEKDGQRFYTIDQKVTSPLATLKKIKKGDIVLTAILDEQKESYVQSRISPHVAVITNPTDLKLLEFQTYNNFLVANDATVDSIKESNLNVKAKILRTGLAFIPAGWRIMQSHHMKENMALSLRVAELFKVDFDDIQDLFETFKNLKGRLEPCKNNIYNDSASVRPLATYTALKTIAGQNDTVLILGGGDVEDDVYDLFQVIPVHVSLLILIPGSGTMKLHQANINSVYATSIAEALQIAKEHAKGGKILFSPGFSASTSVRDRNEEFLKALKELNLHK